MRLARRLLPAALLLALALARTASADDPKVSPTEVSALFSVARDRVDYAASALDRAKAATPQSDAAWAEARDYVKEARDQLTKARDLWNKAKAQGTLGSEMGPSVLHSLADQWRRLADVQRQVPAAPLPPPPASTPESQKDARRGLTEYARRFDRDLRAFSVEFEGKPEGAMNVVKEALDAIRAALANADADPAAAARLPAVLQATLAFIERYHTERRALIATLEEIRHYKRDIAAATPASPPRRGGLIGGVERVSTAIDAAALAEARRNLPELERRATSLLSTHLVLP